MKCPKCGTENDNLAKTCKNCGAELQAPAPQQSLVAIVGKSNIRLLGIVGLIAGIIALVGIFLSWFEVRAFGMSRGSSGWDLMTNGSAIAEEVGGESWATIAFIGAILLLAGAVAALVLPKMKIPWGVLALGGLLAIIGAAWGLADIETGSALGVSADYGTGIYMTLAGGILGLVGLVGVWKAISSP